MNHLNNHPVSRPKRLLHEPPRRFRQPRVLASPSQAHLCLVLSKHVQHQLVDVTATAVDHHLDVFCREFVGSAVPTTDQFTISSSCSRSLPKAPECAHLLCFFAVIGRRSDVEPSRSEALESLWKSGRQLRDLPTSNPCMGSRPS